MDASGPRHRRLTRPQEFETIAEDEPSLSPKLVQSATPARASTCPPSPGWNDADQAAGPKQLITLSDSSLLAKICCCIPAFIMFPLMLAIITAASLSQQAFYWITAMLSVWGLCYSTNLSISCAIGAFRMRRDVRIDWHAKLQQLEEDCPWSDTVMHIVFLPNYKEDETMMLHTLENLARSAMARQNMHVVLCMEEREGEVAREKAAALLDSTRHLFADIFATFHPAGLPGEVAGKSSNVQWAYRQVLQRWASQFAKRDASTVFLTCCDADTLFHPQYFSAMTYQGMTMPCYERAWSLWQPPILLFRNLFSSPAPTRVSGYATLLFELAGLSNQKFSPHFSFSTYSMTLALASHHFVDGWDKDVIAEDHHMFCKCYFASIWEQLQAWGSESRSASIGQQRSIPGDVKSSMQLHPVYLPAIAYLVESDDGWLASIHARFVQARRHSQGLAELSYVFLQHMHLLMSKHAKGLGFWTHVRILCIAGKMASVHIITSMHTFAFIVALCSVVPGLVRWVLSQGANGLLQTLLTQGLEGALSMQSWGGLQWALCAIFGPLPPMEIMMGVVTFLVVKDTLEGKLTSDVAISKKVDPMELAAPDVQGSVKGPNGMTWWSQLRLFLFLQNDYFSGAIITIFFYQMFPAILASWSLLFKNGRGFQYIVGLKPTDAA